MKASTIFQLVTLFFVLGLFASVFVLPIHSTHSETCTSCGGDGIVTCETCHGSEDCWVCGGDGIINIYPPGYQWCGACQGTGACYTCASSGIHSCSACRGSGLLVSWMYTSLGSSIVLSIFIVLLFLGVFGMGNLFTAVHLEFNEWVYDIEEMGFWFNPSFMVWLFATDRERWARWQISVSLLSAIYSGVFIFWISSYNNLTQDVLFIGFFGAVLTTLLFSLIFYKAYTSRLEDSDY